MRENYVQKGCAMQQRNNFWSNLFSIDSSPSHLSPSVGAIGQLLDSLEEIQVLAGASEDDVNFLQNFFEHQTLQALLEVRMQFVKSL